MNSFYGANLEFPNDGVHAMLSEIVRFRKQLTTRPEFMSQSGWTDALNAYMVEELERLSDTLENITYNPDETTKDDIEGQAANTARTLKEDYNERALTADNVLLPAFPARVVRWKLDGSDVDLPQVNEVNCPNDWGRTFITGLDKIFVMLTRLDSRFQPFTITKQESAMVRAMLNALYTVTQRKGGEVNRADLPTGTMPSQEPKTFQGQ